MYDEHMYEKLHTPLRMVRPPMIRSPRGLKGDAKPLPEAEPSPLSVELMGRVPHSRRARELDRGSRGKCPIPRLWG